MGAEQSALLVCTQTGNHEDPLRLPDSEKFFRLKYGEMPEPCTGPVTEALLHLIRNVPQPNFVEDQEQDSGYEHEGHDDEWQEQDQDMVTDEEIDLNQLSDTDMSIGSTSTQLNFNNDDMDFEIAPLEFVDLQPVEFLNVEDPELALEQDFFINIDNFSEE